ncbi:WD40-repeat-containing domain protein [Thamnocephalis sphaerospora]|uniref:WD40-repeat-containing domain protein n=1 Tax=Thamnocephalis sphaerospora TaxID=78915 RepID=A0A4P9XS14_9FUNG|nr:WD40-repeat-containing domain protein [Thamnocephalis sphaerospora]|eukprot:RKP08896.1 WD40-repeat-containing domain protein [Thamnocephalis sphaerospora]
MIRSPGASTPSRMRISGDRYIATRSGRDLRGEFHMARSVGSAAAVMSPPSRGKRKAVETDAEYAQEQREYLYDAVLANEVFNSEMQIGTPQSPEPTPRVNGRVHQRFPPASPGSPSMRGGRARQRVFPPYSAELLSDEEEEVSSPVMRPPGGGPLLNFRSPTRTGIDGAIRHRDLLRGPDHINASLFPVSRQSQRMLSIPRRPMREICSTPCKVLDAPKIANNYYLNLLDWSSTNILGVGLGRCVYLWNAQNASVTKLCQLPDNDTVTSVSWMPQASARGRCLAVGTELGYVKVWDVQSSKEIQSLACHHRRVSVMAWSNATHLASAGRDRIILQRDTRTPKQIVQRWSGHQGEVCGLRWNPSDTQLASGGNDNCVHVWDYRRPEPLWRFTEHKAAVKAVAWSPHQEGLLGTGGGKDDFTIRFWNTVHGTPLSEINTGAQVCNLAWSQHSNEIVSTHGYASESAASSTTLSQNNLRIWRYPKMRQLMTLGGHTDRVLYMACAPDGRTVVTGAPDETLRFWEVFDPPPSEREPTGALTMDCIR